MSEKYTENYFFQQESHLIESSHLLLHSSLRMPCMLETKTKPCSCAKKWSDKGGWLGSEQTKEEGSESEPSEEIDCRTTSKITNFRDYGGSSSYCCCSCYLIDLRRSEKFRQIRELYRMLIMPNNFLKIFLASFNLADLKKVFRKKALLLHPDKNSHPNAKVAF